MRSSIGAASAALVAAVLLATPSSSGAQVASQELGVTALAERKAAIGVKPRVLMIAAHPDDEDTQLITWLERGHRANTAYLALTRGDGGQNLIGNELGEALGVIRTEELLAARRIDGASQYFTRAFDFGFSKTAQETFKHWPKDSLLGDVVKVVRAFRPDIIVSVFSGTPRDGHGHHQVAGILAREAYDLAADTVRFPRAKYGAPWTVSKFYRSAWFARDMATLSMNVGEYYKVLGRSYAEIAALSRSQHKSQGFGTAQRKGTILDYVKREDARVKVSADPKQERSLFDGIDTTRLSHDELNEEAYALVAADIAVEAFAEREYVAVGDSVAVKVSVYKRGVLDSTQSRTVFVHGSEISQPYWLVKPRTGDLFTAASDSISDNERERRSWITVPVAVEGHAKPIDVRVPPVFRYADPVRGDVQRPLITTPAISLTVGSPVQIVRAGSQFSRPIEVTVRSSLTRPSTAMVRLDLPEGVRADSIARTVKLEAGATRTVTFYVDGAVSSGEHVIRASAEVDGRQYSVGFIPIEYDHIMPQRMYRSAETRLTGIDVEIPAGLKIGYVQGVGDNVAPILAQLGVAVSVLDPAKFPVTNLSQYTTIVVGPRAYQASQALVDNNSYLLDYARAGGNLVVQYGQYEMQTPGMMPYPITLGRPASRVTEEDAAVEIVDASAELLTKPNRITQADFDGWVQERSLYMPTTFDERYKTMLSMHDEGEAPNRASILTTPLGRGRYTYVTLALFRQLPAGNAGGIRLFANLISATRP